MQSQTRIFSRRVGEFAIGPAVVLRHDDTVSTLVARMAEANRSGALILDDAGQPAGIVTERDILRRVALRCTGDEPVSAIMTTPVTTVSSADYLYVAIATMRRRGWRHLPVVDDDGRLVGIVERHEALAMAAEHTVGLIEAVTHEGTLDGLREIKAVQVEVADSLLRDHVPAAEVQRMLTRLNRDIHRRVVDLCVAAMAADGRGPPPVDFALIIMGSGGRGENYLYPDQDNGLILDDYADAEHGRIDGWFVELATRLTAMLDAVGFPLCRGNVMATNPVWRKTRGQWREQLRVWGRRHGLTVVRLSDIFFDFRSGAGRRDFARELRRAVFAMLRESPAFVADMAREAAGHGVALGWLGRLRPGAGKAARRGEIDLKHHGLVALVTNVRLMALRHGIEETPTLDRIERLAQAGAIDGNRRDDLAAAFETVTGLLLRRQIEDFRAGRPVGYAIQPKALSRRERRGLVEALQAIAAFRDTVHGG